MDGLGKSPWVIAALEGFRKGEAGKPVFPLPPALTYSALRFYNGLHETFGLLVFLTDASAFADNAAFVASKIVAGETDLPGGFDPRVPLSDKPGPFRTRLELLQHSFLAMLLIRAVDDFTTYITEVIRECLAARAELLRSSETVRVDFVLSYDNLDELKDALVDRKVMELSFMGFEKICDWIEEHLGIGLRKTFGGQEVLLQAIEARNCFVHSHGIVTSKYLRTVANSVYHMGDRLDVSVDDVYLAGQASVEFVDRLDAALSQKFKLSKVNRSASADGAGIEVERTE